MSYRDLAINQRIVLGRKKRDREQYGSSYSGNMGKDIHHNMNICVDFLRPHVMLICGKKGYGKSYTMGVLTEEFLSLEPEIRQNLAFIIADPMGIFWSMKMKNIDEYEQQMLADEGLEEESYQNDIQIMIPATFEKKYQENGWLYDKGFLLNPGELDDVDWCHALDIDVNSVMGLSLSLAISTIKENMGDNYLIRHIIREIKNMDKEEASSQTKLALTRRFSSLEKWGIFAGESDVPTRIYDFITPGKVTVLNLVDIREDISGGWGLRSLVLALISRKIFEFRTKARREELSELIDNGDQTKSKESFPMVWMLIDEAHRFAPSRRTTAASLSLRNWSRLGRQPGLSLVVATQRPGSLDMDILSQCDLILSHRLTAQVDVEALNRIRPTYSSSSILDHIDTLPKDEAGSAIAIDDTNETVISMRVRPRKSWHSGFDAIAKKTDDSLD
jgi:uncharacterized protein